MKSGQNCRRLKSSFHGNVFGFWEYGPLLVPLLLRLKYRNFLKSKKYFSKKNKKQEQGLF